MEFNIFDFLFLPVLIGIGSIVSYEDLKFGLIRNRWVKAGFFWGFGVMAFFLLSEFFPFKIQANSFLANIFIDEKDTSKIFFTSFSYIIAQMINSSVAFLVGFLLWKKRIWAPGDAKLFFIFSLLLPLKYYQNAYLPIFPSFVLLSNVFFLIFSFFLLKGVMEWLKTLCNKKNVINFFQEKIKDFFSKNIAEVILKGAYNYSAILLIFLIFRLMPLNMLEENYFLNSKNFSVLFLIGMILFRSVILSFLSNKKIIYFFSLIFLFLYFRSSIFGKAEETIIFLFSMGYNFIIFIFIFYFLNRLINFYLKRKSKKSIEIEKVSCGMLIDKKIIDKMISQNSSFKKFFPTSSFFKGITNEQVFLLKKWAKQENKKEVEIYFVFPFALWMFLGVWISLITKGSLLVLFLDFLNG